MLKRLYLYINIIILCQAVFCCEFLESQTLLKKKDNQVIITSEKVDLDNQKKEAFYSGGVKIVKGEMTLTSDTLRVKFNEEGQGISQIQAKGGIKFYWKDRYAEAEEGIYDDLTQTITLSGSPKTWQDENMVKGEKIIYNLNEDKVLIEGDVETILYIGNKIEN